MLDQQSLTIKFSLLTPKNVLNPPTTTVMTCIYISMKRNLLSFYTNTSETLDEIPIPSPVLTAYVHQVPTLCRTQKAMLALKPIRSTAEENIITRKKD